MDCDGTACRSMVRKRGLLKYILRGLVKGSYFFFFFFLDLVYVSKNGQENYYWKQRKILFNTVIKLKFILYIDTKNTVYTLHLYFQW